MRIEAEGVPEAIAARFSRVGDCCLRAEGLTGRYQAFVEFVGADEMQTLNREQRGVDRVTDVLSFPSARFPRGTARDNARRLRREIDPETGCVHLGDVAICPERAREQAASYGHSVTRETCFLFAHAMLHLMGYDHEEDKDRAVMRAMEETIMREAGLPRELTDEDVALLDAAREAMHQAYAPYSRYRVGAAVRVPDGRVFAGCNVENASFGLTLCAERNAMTTAVTAGARALSAVAIAAEGAMPYPCGACRQFLREFARDCRVVVTNGQETRVTCLSALLPNDFGPESLPEVRV